MNGCPGAKVAAGEIKSFTGMSADAPYEAPLHPEVDLPNRDLSVDECVQRLLDVLRREGVLEGGVTDPSGLPLPPGYVDGWLEESLHLSGAAAISAKQQALSLPKVRLNDIDVNWLQVLGEGWAAGWPEAARRSRSALSAAALSASCCSCFAFAS